MRSCDHANTLAFADTPLVKDTYHTSERETACYLKHINILLPTMEINVTYNNMWRTHLWRVVLFLGVEMMFQVKCIRLI